MTRYYLLIPNVEAEWQATTAALAELDEELSVPLGQLLDEVVAAVERRTFHQRIVGQRSGGVVEDQAKGVAES